MNIALVVGHDANSQGAYGNKGKSEFKFYDELLLEMASKGLFPDKHNIYVLYRSADIKGYSAKMRDLHHRIDELKCEVSIELHFNSFHRPEANGNEVLYCSKAGKEIADIFDEALDILPNRDRGVKAVRKNDRGAGFCCRGKSKAIILEPFFGAYQSQYVYNGKNRNILLKAIANGLDKL